MSRRTNVPTQGVITRAQSKSGHNTPRQPSPTIATDPSAICALQFHIFDIDNIRDRHYRNLKYIVCTQQPCPNRYDTKSTNPIPDYGEECMLEQEALVIEAELKQQDRKHCEADKLHHHQLQHPPNLLPLKFHHSL